MRETLSFILNPQWTRCSGISDDENDPDEAQRPHKRRDRQQPTRRASIETGYNDGNRILLQCGPGQSTRLRCRYQQLMMDNAREDAANRAANNAPIVRLSLPLHAPSSPVPHPTRVRHDHQ